MTIAIRFFAVTRDLTGQSAMALELPEGATVATAIAALVQQFPSLKSHIDRLAIAVDLEYVPRDHPLRDGQELALIPPVSGGKI